MENEGENVTAALLGQDRHAQPGVLTAEKHLLWYQLRRPWHIGFLVILSATFWIFSLATSRIIVAKDDIYDELNFLRLNDVLHYVCRLLSAIPFRILADRARKPVFILASVGQILSIT